MATTEFLKRILSKRPTSTLQNALSVYDDYLFDKCCQLDTRSEIAIDDLEISQEAKKHADNYKPTSARYFRKIMEKVDLRRDGVFVDVGCGKGRILLLAAEQGFDQIDGLEISPALCQIAERNIDALSKSKPESGSIKVICTNILDYQMDGNETRLFRRQQSLRCHAAEPAQIS